MIKITQIDSRPFFHLSLKNTVYAMGVNEAGKLLHHFWGPKPSPSTRLPEFKNNATLHETSNLCWDDQTEPAELVTFGDVSYHQVALKLNFSMGRDKAPVRDCRLRYRSHKIDNCARPGMAPAHGLPHIGEEAQHVLRIDMADPEYPLEVSLYYRITPVCDVLERWISLKNTGDESIVIEQCAFASLALPNGTTEVSTIDGRWAREFTTRRSIVPIGTHIIEQHALHTGHEANPFFLINRPRQASESSGLVYAGALAFSSNFQICLEQLPSTDIRVHAGYNPFDFELRLESGKTHTTPQLITTCSNQGWSGASRCLHQFIREYIQAAPEAKEFLRPVLYNSWEATYFNLSMEGQAKLADRAASIGVELFCVDDGWFGARRSDNAGLGDWFVSRDVFPDGLKPLADHIHTLGMKFGLWVEPEMVNCDSDLYRRHPDWVLHFPNRPRTECRNQLILDLGRREVVEYLFERLDTLVRDYEIDFFKWDMNRRHSEPGSVAGKASWIEHIAGVYEIMDRLKKSHPHLDIQSCSGGGGRVDAGILGRTEQTWISDNTDALDRTAIQEGYSLAYPARAMECWVTHEKNHITQRVLPLSMRFDVAMRGTLGIGSSLDELDDGELAEYARYIKFYKQIRPTVQTGKLFRLQRLEENGASVIAYVNEDGSEAVVSFISAHARYGIYLPPCPLTGLRSSATYAVINYLGETSLKLSGFELMTRGFPVNSPVIGNSQFNRNFSGTWLLTEE